MAEGLIVAGQHTEQVLEVLIEIIARHGDMMLNALILIRIAYIVVLAITRYSNTVILLLGILIANYNYRERSGAV